MKQKRLHVVTVRCGVSVTTCTWIGGIGTDFLKIPRQPLGLGIGPHGNHSASPRLLSRLEIESTYRGYRDKCYWMGERGGEGRGGEGFGVMEEAKRRV